MQKSILIQTVLMFQAATVLFGLNAFALTGEVEKNSTSLNAPPVLQQQIPSVAPEKPAILQGSAKYGDLSGGTRYGDLTGGTPRQSLNAQTQYSASVQRQFAFEAAQRQYQMNAQRRTFSLNGTAPSSGVRAAIDDGVHPFLPTDIAKSGADGILQLGYPNCWFEASLAAVAQTDKGRQMISSMITSDSTGNYNVNFPGSQTINVTLSETSRVADFADWARVMEAAEVKKFPDNDAANSPQNGHPKIQIGIELLTGKHSDFIRPDASSPSQLSQIIEEKLRMQVPVVLATKGPSENCQAPAFVTPNHAYTVVSINGDWVVLRNPLGTVAEARNASVRNRTNLTSSRLRTAAIDFSHPDEIVQDLGNGYIRANLNSFSTFFRFLAWGT